MAKKVLVTYMGAIMEIVDPGKEYEIYIGDDATLKWMDCSDDSITLDWIMKAGVFVKNDAAPIDFTLRRKVAYGDVGAQLDMQYKDLLNGTTTWKDHIAAVKAANDAPSKQPDYTDVAPNGTIENPAWKV